MVLSRQGTRAVSAVKVARPGNVGRAPIVSSCPRERRRLTGNGTDEGDSRWRRLAVDGIHENTETEQLQNRFSLWSDRIKTMALKIESVRGRILAYLSFTFYKCYPFEHTLPCTMRGLC